MLVIVAFAMTLGRKLWFLEVRVFEENEWVVGNF
jgi:hypothetical protein